jgi:hypothetical protein
VEDCKALVDAKEQGKEAITAVKAQITQDHAALAEVRKVERRVTAEKKAKQAEQRVRVQYHPPDVY